jgi:hypothetical protein
LLFAAPCDGDEAAADAQPFCCNLPEFLRSRKGVAVAPLSTTATTATTTTTTSNPQQDPHGWYSTGARVIAWAMIDPSPSQYKGTLNTLQILSDLKRSNGNCHSNMSCCVLESSNSTATTASATGASCNSNYINSSAKERSSKNTVIPDDFFEALTAW